MTFLKKIFISLICISFLSVLSIVFFAQEDSINDDFIPLNTKNTSIHINNFLSNKKEFKSIDKYINRFIKKNNLAGASLAISKDGQLKFAKGYGMADKEKKIAVQPYNLFRIASASKLLTATAIMKLVERNKLKLSDKVFGVHGILNDSIYLNYKDKKVTQITVKELLNHTSGWTNRWGDPMFIPWVVASHKEFNYPITSEDIIRFMLQKRLYYAPGSIYAYSNFGYAVLGKVIEKISGLDYESFVKTEILYPLGIFDTQIGGSYQWERLKLEVKYYEPEDFFLVPDHLNPEKKVLRSYGGNDMKALGSAGGWISSAPDLLKLVAAIDGFNTRPDIISKESIKKMITIDKGQAGTSPLGWRGIKRNYWYRTGTLAGTSALIVRYNNGISYAIIFNSSSWKGPKFANDTRQIMDRVLKSIKKWPSYDLFKLK